MTLEEVEIVAGWCTQPGLVVFLALSGLRIGEALALRDTEVDRESRRVKVERSARTTTHDLTHSFASLLIWKRSAHLYEGSGRQAVAVLDRHLAAVAS